MAVYTYDHVYGDNGELQSWSVGQRPDPLPHPIIYVIELVWERIQQLERLHEASPDLRLYNRAQALRSVLPDLEKIQ